MIIFGPVPSRRLGRSLGINTIFKKHCTYSCIYCQIGRTPTTEIIRRPFYQPEEITKIVTKRIQHLQATQDHIDYLTIVSEGEPTLDLHLGETLRQLKKLQIPVAVITNASLLDKKDVRGDLSNADCVSVKIDAATPEIWRKINRPHSDLNLEKIMQGIHTFVQEYSGRLLTETMLIHRINSEETELRNIASFIKKLSVDTSYLSLPIRPPADASVHPATKETIDLATHIFHENNIPIQINSDYEGSNLSYLNDVEQEILSIASVHPIREEGIQELLHKAQADWEVIEKLIKNGKLKETTYKNKRFYRTIGKQKTQ